MPLATVTLLISIGLLLTGHGIQLTLLPLYANTLGWGNEIISLTGASYFAGFMFGSLIVPRLLSRAGYIRVFLTFSALLAMVILSLGLTQNISAWMILRFMTGLSIVGIYLTSESWLNASVLATHRGKMLSIYALVSLLGIGLGQTLVGLVNFDDLFQICAIIMLLSLIPVGLFCTEEPIRPEYLKLKISDIAHLPPFAIGAIVLGAVMTASIWTVAPLFGHEKGLSSWEISMMMNAIVFGAVVFQFPLGILSDKFDRRRVLLGTAFACLVTISLISLASSDAEFLLLCFIFGGLSLTQYVLCAAYANEQSSLSKVKVASLVLMLNGGGSVAGPLLVAVVSLYSENALLIVSGSSMFLLVAISLCMKGTVRRAIILRLPNRHLRKARRNNLNIAV